MSIIYLNFEKVVILSYCHFQKHYYFLVLSFLCIIVLEKLGIFVYFNFREGLYS